MDTPTETTMYTLTEIADVLGSQYPLIIRSTARILAILAALKFIDITFESRFWTLRILNALGRQHTTPFNYEMLFNLGTEVTNPLAVALEVLSALIVLLSDDHYEKIYWTAVLILTTVMFAFLSQRETAGSTDRLEAKDDDRALLVGEGIYDGKEINRQLMQWKRTTSLRTFFAASIGLTLMPVLVKAHTW